MDPYGADCGTPCETCNDRRHVRTAAGWARCPACWPALISQTFIVPDLKHGESELSPSVLAREPWGLADRTERGDWDHFRWMAWRSLLHLYDERPTFRYQVVSAFRLQEIYFERDPEFASLFSLILDFDLVIILSRPGDITTSFIPKIVQQVVRERHWKGRATWNYASLSVVHLPPPRQTPELGRTGQRALLEA